MVTIDTTPLSPGQHDLDVFPTAEEAGLDEEVFSEIRVSARLDLRPASALVRLSVSASATLTCDRTLVEFRQPISGGHVLLFLADESAGASSASAEDVRPLPEPGMPLDVTDAVHDTLLLALPVRRVAPGADDEPIETVFGDAGDSELDPRWEALRKLRDAS